MNMKQAPELRIETWLNSAAPISLKDLRGRVVLIEAFQMLCPGCVSHGLPQATLVAETFSKDDVVVLGLHSVFEHHSAQGREDVLSAFLHENKIRFPVGMDMPSSGNTIPETMAAYQLRGTPSTILIDRMGRHRLQHFGRVNDLVLGAEIMSLVADKSGMELLTTSEADATPPLLSCSDSECSV
jgi:hypothetical protein